MNLFGWLVLSMSAILAAVVLVWLLSPDLRERMELPKHRMLEHERLLGERSDARAAGLRNPDSVIQTDPVRKRIP